MQGEDKCAKKQKLNQVFVEQYISELISSALTIMTLVSILHCTISCWLDTPLISAPWIPLLGSKLPSFEILSPLLDFISNLPNSEIPPHIAISIFQILNFPPPPKVENK